jgi:hypothetical protein
MQANPEQFQAIAVGNNSFDKSPIFQIGTANISCDEVVKLLGVDIDFRTLRNTFLYICPCANNIPYFNLLFSVRQIR